MGEEVAERRDLARPPSSPLILASTSPQRRAILEQLRIPFDVVRPDYEEEPGVDPVEHARAKARSVARVAGDGPVLGVDTEVLCDGRLFGKPRDEEDAAEMLNALSGRTHEVTRVSFRTLTPRDVATYVAAGEWQGRAGAYAVQGFGASLVERIEGDYLNIVGLPASRLVRLLAERFSGTYGFG
jgi:nucleoside triphosphate pyrophosphatase